MSPGLEVLQTKWKLWKKNSKLENSSLIKLRNTENVIIIKKPQKQQFHGEIYCYRADQKLFKLGKK